MFFQRLKTPGLGHNSYLLGCGDGLAVVVDPRRDVEEFLRLAQDHGLSIRYILETHRQEDFEFGSATLAELTGAQIVGGDHELFGRIDINLADGAELVVGTTRIVALATPGHTPESVSYAVYLKDAGEQCWGVFSGDTLFVGDTGRTDLFDRELASENAGLLYDMVQRKLMPLGGSTLLYPAHGAGSACGGNISSRDDSTIGLERETNPVFTKSRDAFIEHKLAERMARPPHFLHMEEVNLLAGRRIPAPTAHVFQPKEFERVMQNGLVIDTRSPEAFAGAHIRRSYNIWLDGLPAMGSWVVSQHQNSPLYLVLDTPADLETAVRSLARIGIDSVEGVLGGGIEAWREQGLPIDNLATISAAEAMHGVQQGQFQILDVRDQYEWDEKHIPWALHRFVGELEAYPPAVDRDTDIAVHCSVGHRSGLAASILKRSGFRRIHNLLGGITAWEALGLPLRRAAGQDLDGKNKRPAPAD